MENTSTWESSWAGRSSLKRSSLKRSSLAWPATASRRCVPVALNTYANEGVIDGPGIGSEGGPSRASRATPWLVALCSGQQPQASSEPSACPLRNPAPRGRSSPPKWYFVHEVPFCFVCAPRHRNGTSCTKQHFWSEKDYERFSISSMRKRLGIVFLSTDIKDADRPREKM